ncbi:beta strand repeat-containing protein [Deinococcus radiotolerans]|uniref:Uncharacterized protein n=1 Tax=Deinococcus radiotolerans TaxID=1309407 RepID=A0ABQ2FE53_9DEIO|nr:hypothetical protein [Deinococcus radiotolerans]GGK85765.1 hypothetical protein GCM10010844_00350 [Deinococcus radiotolerans]
MNTTDRTRRRPPLMILLGLSLLLGCARTAAPLPGGAAGPAPTAPTAPSAPTAPTPGLGSTLGLMEIKFERIGADGMTATARAVPHTLAGQALTTTGGVQMELASRGSFVTGTRGAGGYRHLYATFRVRNASSSGVAATQARSNLTFVAASTPSTVGETPLSTFTKFDGSAASAATAPTITPTHGMLPDPLTGGARLMPGGEDLQFFTEQEVDPLRFTTPTTPAALGVTRLFPYGFVVRNATTPGSRALSANPGVNQFDGLVTFAVKVPLQSSAADDPFSFSMLFEAMDDSVTRVSESAEEQALGTQAAARAATLNATEVAALCGTSISSPSLKFIPSVTTAGNSARLAKLGGDFIITEYGAPARAAVGNTTTVIPASQGPLTRVQAVPTQGQPAPTLTATTTPTSARGGNVTASADGSLTFNPKAGDGNVTDTISSSVSDGSCSTPTGVLKNTVNIGQRVWYVNNASAVTPDGRQSSPFTTLLAAQNASSAGDILYVYRGDGTTTGQNAGVTLKANQKLIGQGVPLTVSGIAVEPAGQTPSIGQSSGAAVTLPADATSVSEISGLTISSGAQGVTGTGFGTLTVSNLSVSATGGPALNLSSGTVNGTLSTLSSSGSATSGLNFSSVNGTLTGTGGTVTGAAGAAVSVSGGALNLTYGGSVTKASAGALLSVSGGHTGTLNLSGSLNASNGTGLQFDNADGTYTASTATLNGGDAGIDILNNSAGTFSFGSGVNVTNPSGDAFTVTDSTPTVTMLGAVSKASAGRAVNITNMASGTVTFGAGGTAGSATPTLSASAGDGILLSNMDGTVNFTGTTTLGGTSGGIDILNGSAGTILFADTSSVTGSVAADPALLVDSGTPTVTYRGSLTHNTGRVITAQSLTGGSVTLNGAVTSGTSGAPTGQGVLIQNNTAGAVSFLGTKTFYTGPNPAVTISTATGSGPTVSFPNGGLAITTTTGTGLSATGSGTLTVGGTTNTISSGLGGALNVQNTTIGAGGLNFRQINANGGTYGVRLVNTGAAAGLTVSGAGTAGSGGTIQNTSTAGVSVTNGSNLNLSWMNFTNATSVDGGGAGVCDGSTNAGCNAPVNLSAVTGVTLDRLAINGSAEEGINGRNIRNFTLSNSTVTNAGDAIHEYGVNLFELLGTNAITGTTVTGAANHGVFVRVSSATTAAPGTPDKLQITGSTFMNPGRTVNLPSDGVTVSLRNTANFQTVVQSSSFTQATATSGTDGIQVDAGDTSVSDVSITDSTFTGWNQSAINLSGSQTSRTRFNVTANRSVSGGAGMGINVFSGNDADLTGTIANNPITTPDPSNNGYGIALAVEDSGHITADLNSNNVTNYAFGLGGYTRSVNLGELDATIRNNTVTAGGNFAFAGLFIENANGNNQGNRVCLNLTNNNISMGTNPAAVIDYSLGSYQGSTFQLQGLTGVGTSSTNVQNFVSSRDIGGASVDVTAGTTVNFVNATCLVP